MKSDLALAARVLLWLALMGLGLGLLAAHDWEVEQLLGRIPMTAPWWFVAAMAVLPLIGFPIAVFYLYAGSVYGFWAGWSLCLLALALNLAASYVVGAHLLNEPLRRFLTRRGHRWPDLSTQNQLRATFLLRTIPGPPYPVQNYFLAASGVTFGIYWPVSWLTQGVLAAGMVSLGHFTTLPKTRLYVLLGLALVAVLVLLKWWFRRRAPRGPADSEATS